MIRNLAFSQVISLKMQLSIVLGKPLYCGIFLGSQLEWFQLLNLKSHEKLICLLSEYLPFSCGPVVILLMYFYVTADVIRDELLLAISLLNLQIGITPPSFATDGASLHAILGYGCVLRGQSEMWWSLEFIRILRPPFLLLGRSLSLSFHLNRGSYVWSSYLVEGLVTPFLLRLVVLMLHVTSK